jgi:DNA topoisomerase VI subunit B
VSDQGTGIEEKDLPHIFDKFYRGTRQGYQKGTGLGLAIVKHIIEMHGGHLGVRSEIGSGTTFRIDLPRNYAMVNNSEDGAPEAGKKEQDPPPTGTPLEALREFEEENEKTGSSDVSSASRPQQP